MSQTLNLTQFYTRAQIRALLTGTSGAIPVGILLSGTTDPTSGTGSDGNFYLNTATKTLFGPRSAGAWPTIGTLN